MTKEIKEQMMCGLRLMFEALSQIKCSDDNTAKAQVNAEQPDIFSIETESDACEETSPSLRRTFKRDVMIEFSDGSQKTYKTLSKASIDITGKDFSNNHVKNMFNTLNRHLLPGRLKVAKLHRKSLIGEFVEQ